ncbi:hypothetical protein ACFWPQ_38295 [Streptomyces sp. NPDC058464]|uniref:hypothetical protein n=1 Tax=Streptomyces sp. NPDC058464 TaxID=3346511 RepID=UPI00364F8AD0
MNQSSEGHGSRSRGPFRPFVALDAAPFAFASWQDAEGVVADTLRGVLRWGIISGPVGAGKSSFFQTRARAVIESNGWRPVYLSAGQIADPDNLLIIVASSLGREPGVQQIQQSAGDVERSSSVNIVQMIQSATATSGPGTDSVLARLLSLVTEGSERVCLLIDQAEQLVVEETAEQKSILTSLIAISCLEHSHLAVILGVRDRYMGELLARIAQTTRPAQYIGVIRGVTTDDAVKYAQSALADTPVRIPPRRLAALSKKVATEEGLVWPVAWQAILEEEYTRRLAGNRSQREATPAEVLARAVRARLEPLERSQAEDALVVLHQIARLSASAGPQAVRSIAASAPGLTEYDVQLAMAHLDAFGLVREIRPGRFGPAHDSLLSAALLLRTGGSQDELEIELLDRGVGAWLGQNETPSNVVLQQLELQLASGEIASPHFVCVAAISFDRLYRRDDRLLHLIRRVGRSMDSETIRRVVLSRAGRLGRPAELEPAEIFALLVPQDSEGGLNVLRILTSMNEEVKSFNDSLIRRAIVDSGNTELLGLLTGETQTWPLRIWRLVLDSYCVRGMQSPSEENALRLWAKCPPRAKGSLLRLLSDHHYLWLQDEVGEIQRSEDSEIASFGLRITLTSRAHGWRETLGSFFTSADVDLRRRTVLQVPAVASLLDEGYLIQKFSSEPSALVREAFTEIAADILPRDRFPLLQLALQDRSEIVREGATYALRTSLPKENALELLQLVERDPSPLIREAILQVVTHYQEAPSAEFLRTEVRLGQGTVRAAALRLLGTLRPDEAGAVLADVLTQPESDREMRMAALGAASVIRSEMLIGSLRSLLSTSHDMEEITACLDALESIRSPECVTVIAGASRHSSGQVRERAIYALVRLGGPVATEAIASCIFDPDPSVQAPAIYGLARLGVRDYSGDVRRMEVRSDWVRRAVEFYLR